MTMEHHTQSVGHCEIVYGDGGRRGAPVFGLDCFALYVFDYGAPAGYRIASASRTHSRVRRSN